MQMVHCLWPAALVGVHVQDRVQNFFEGAKVFALGAMGGRFIGGLIATEQATGTRYGHKGMYVYMFLYMCTYLYIICILDITCACI